MTPIEEIARWLAAHPGVVAGVAVGSGALLLLGLLALPWVVGRLPPDHFVRPPGRSHPARWIARNVVGALVLASGIAMLVLPGQGLLTMLAGLMLVDFPGKRRLLVALLRRPAIGRGVDAIRRRAGRPPLELPEPEG